MSVYVFDCVRRIRAHSLSLVYSAWSHQVAARRQGTAIFQVVMVDSGVIGREGIDTSGLHSLLHFSEEFHEFLLCVHTRAVRHAVLKR